METKIHLHIGTLIEKLVVVNIPSADNTNSSQYPEYLTECVKSAVESALIKVVTEIDIDKETSQKDSFHNTAQKKPH